jgi:tripartite-type tricarboxylate transporter receptor subunit TctC
MIGRPTIISISACVALSLAISLTAGSAPVRADAVADFYRGKTVTIVLGTGPGRTYDLYARLLASHMPKHIPGKPNMVVQYMRGAGGLKATNYMYNAAPQDGTVIATLFASLPLLEKLRPKAAKYESQKFGWLGAYARIVNVIAVNSDAPAVTIEQAKKKEVVIGSIGKSNSTYQWPALLNSVLGTKFKIISGYRSGGAIYKAMESGEVHGYSPVWLSLSATKADWLKEK